MAAKATGVAQRPRLVVPGRLSRRPSTLKMVKEALQAHDEKKGASVSAIKQFILAKYPAEDPIRLKYLLKQALSKGLSRGELVRPHNSSAVGATGTFMLPPKEPQRQHLGRANSDRGPSRKPGQKGTTEAPSAPMAGAQQQGTTKQQLMAVKQKPKAKPVDAQPQAAEKPRNDGAKPLRAANHSQVPGTGRSGPLRAADHPQAPRKGSPRPPRAADHPQAPGTGPLGPRVTVAAEDAGVGKSNSSVGAGAKVPQGKSKGKVLKGAQQDVLKAPGCQGRVRKPQVTTGARQGEARLQKAAPPAEDRKAP